MKKIALVLAAIVYNATASSTVEDDFLNTLETVNKEVHEKKLNIDHTPSTISVLRYEDLALIGVKNLQEALSLIPGVETTINNIGWGEVVIRGVRNSNSYGFDKVKILIDGVSVTTALYGSVYYYLDFPIDL
ncbi:MAG: outer rane receptor for ferrienterochelin and colicin, partial [Campylobacterota bacterium]|nr:outer rane receptor for ferrienterochelin and colicin [Campylobacterota bacterium]